ncbi:MAG: tetratricopeptide repeat protein, partial [Anaerolineales bacterium]|nr:tetratricopeptide repeat protein [Anaerolineales bacterium]
MSANSPTNHEIEKLERALAAAGNPIRRVDILNDLARNRLVQEPDKAIQLLAEATTLTIANDYGAGYVQSQLLIAHIHHMMGDIAAAFAHVNKTIEQGPFPLSDEQQNRVRLNLAMLYADLGDYSRALENLHAALKQEVAWGNREGQAQAHVKIGNIYSASGDPALAMEHYQAGLSTLGDLADGFFTGVVYNSYCVDYTKLGEYEKAVHYGTLARELFLKNNDPFGVAIAESSLGEVAMARQAFGDAETHFRQSLERFAKTVKSTDAVELLQTRLNISQALYATGKLVAAQEQAEIVLQQAHTADLRPLARQAHEL